MKDLINLAALIIVAAIAASVIVYAVIGSDTAATLHNRAARTDRPTDW